MTKNVIRLTETDLHNMIKESVKRILKEDISDLYVKCIECYNETDDIVFVAAISETGSDKEAVKKVRREFPHYDIIDITDVSGKLNPADCTNKEMELIEFGAIEIPNAINDVSDLNW